MGALKGKVAIVLGAASAGNMGQAIAKTFTAEGAAVMVAGRQKAELRRFAKSIGAAFQACDITDEAELARLISHAKRQFGEFNIAVNATGRNQVKPFLSVTRAELDAIADVQFIGTFLFMQAVLREIEDHGSIIQISSVSASAMLPNHTAYMASKAAGDTIVRSLALEFGKRGIRVNSIAPGPTIDTPMAADLIHRSEHLARIQESIPLGRLGTSANIAAAALWLASDSCFMTGEVLQVNGGRAIPRLI